MFKLIIIVNQMVYFNLKVFNYFILPYLHLFTLNSSMFFIIIFKDIKFPNLMSLR